jgi:transcriptional regulator with XRE-family HTH domain
MKERIKDIIKCLQISNRKFSESLGNSHAWISYLLSGNTDSLKVRDILEMERLYNINPLFIIKGNAPMFLDN